MNKSVVDSEPQSGGAMVWSGRVISGLVGVALLLSAYMKLSAGQAGPIGRSSFFQRLKNPPVSASLQIGQVTRNHFLLAHQHIQSRRSAVQSLVHVGSDPVGRVLPLKRKDASAVATVMPVKDLPTGKVESRGKPNQKRISKVLSRTHAEKFAGTHFQLWCATPGVHQ